MSTTVLNGQRRPSLNETILRLDRMLDGLADGLQDAVTTAVQVAVQTAVREATEAVLKELLTGAAVLPALATAMMPTPPKPPLLHRIGNACRRTWRKSVNVVKALPSMTRCTVIAIGSGIRRAANAVRRMTVNRVTRTVTSIAGLFILAWRLRRSVPLALIVGAGAATLGYCATPELVALLHGLTVGTLAIMVRLSSPMRRARPAATA
jgi:hypothetical protein